MKIIIYKITCIKYFRESILAKIFCKEEAKFKYYRVVQITVLYFVLIKYLLVIQYSSDTGIHQDSVVENISFQPASSQ